MNIHIKFFLVIVLSVVMLVTPGNVRADDCSLGRMADGVYPLRDEDIVMVSEYVNIKVKSGYAECVFEFKNTGKAREVLMGFPAEMEGDEEEETRLKVEEFKAFQDGVEIPVKLEKGVAPENEKALGLPAYKSWYTFTVKFKAGETVKIKNTYRFHPTVFSTGDVQIGYILKTGALWKGHIGKARVVFDMEGIEPYMIISIYPSTLRFEGDNLVWEQSDVEPFYDLYVVYNESLANKSFLENLDESERKKLEDRKALFDTVKQKASGMKKEELLELYEQAIASKDLVLAKYIASRLPAGAIKQHPPEIEGVELEKRPEGYSVNILVSDRDGDPILCRVKITRNDGGREVVEFEGQDYASNVSGDFKKRFTFDAKRLKKGEKYHLSITAEDSMGNRDYRTFDIVPGGELVAAYLSENPEPLPTKSTSALVFSIAAAVILTVLIMGRTRKIAG
ncbi:MAG: hypothetical protein L5655_03415 [Thermosediminibacteraceae bacterium]|nr:hypothetical protein [Thermosediminibacteraceae bacterium]